MTPSRRRAALTAAGLLLVPMLAGGFVIQERSSREGVRLFQQVLTLVSSRFVDTLADSSIYEKAARGLVHELNDPYTVLLTPKENSAFTTTTGGRYAGVGMQIEEIKGSIAVSKVFPRTPAEEAGIQEGDRIIQIDTTVVTKTWKTEQVSNILRGTPGTKVTVKFARPGIAEPITARFTRATIHIPAIRYAIMADKGIGYVWLEQFNETATDELEAAIRKLQQQGARSLILDLRDNPGGILDQALSVSNLFVKRDQPLLSIRDRNGQGPTYVAKDEPIIGGMPIVTLVDGGSASASEIVAGALQDHDRALLVGTTTFGKGLVQTLFQLDGGYALKMTTAKYYLPSGRSIQRERKVVDGRFVTEDEGPDSLETDSARKARPAFKSDAGRTVYGGGGVTPDVIVKSDTITTVEQAVAKALAAKSQDAYATLANYAQELKGQVTSPAFVVTPQWRDEFYRRLQGASVPVDRKQWDQATPFIDRLLGDRVARLAFGDSAVKRRQIKDDAQLLVAIDVLRRSPSQQELFTIAQRMQTALKK
jgi:carboxyl-terminal processing protease